MTRVVLVPDTNFFLDHPNFIDFLAQSRAPIHLDLLWPVLCELDNLRKLRGHADPKRQERGRKAYQAMESITRLQHHPVDGIEFELYRPKNVEESSHPDAQVVDHVMHLAAEHHPNDEIVFVTSDEGLPKVLFVEETKQRGLKHISLCTAHELTKRIPQFGSPSASIDTLGLNHLPVDVNSDPGAEFFLTYSVADFRHGKASIAIHCKSASSEKWEVVAHTLSIPTVSFTDERRRLFIPFRILGAKPRRRGMDHFWLAIRVWDVNGKAALAQDDTYCLDLALGGCFLSKR